MKVPLFLSFYLTLAVLQRCVALSTQYTPFQHPVYVLPGFAAHTSSLTPVVMKRYYVSGKYSGPNSTVGAVFAPRAATYVHQDTGLPFVTKVDILNINTPYPNLASDPADFGRIYFNYNTRVFALMYAYHKFYRPPPKRFSPNVTGMPSGWKVIGAARTVSGYNEKVGDQKRHPSKIQRHVLVVEAVLLRDDSVDNGGYMIHFPHPWSMEMDGESVRSVAFVFVPPSDSPSDVVDLPSFPEPSVPAPFFSFGLDGTPSEILHPDQDPPIPNRTCPTWLHDLHVTDLTRRWGGSDMHSDEPRYWRTWHPVIDPVYWCYYDHDHGSYTGKLHKPPFGYTAWKTYDGEGSQGRQDESHNGFKVFSWELADGRIVVLTAHMHISRARRFTARFHTIIFAVIRGYGGDDEEVEVELSFKADFGPGMAQSSNLYPVPLDDTQQQIQQEMQNKNRQGNRIFNVINVDENFPDSLDPNFRVKGDISRGPFGILFGLYETWSVMFPSCIEAQNIGAAGIQFDIRDPSTAARFPVGTTDDNIQVMNGFSLRRVFFIREPMVVSLQTCSESMKIQANEKNGLFFTDSYFKQTYSGAGAFRIRQYIKPGLQDVTIANGMYGAAEPWLGTYRRHGGTGLQNIEKAVVRIQN